MKLPFRPERRRALLDEAFRLMPLAQEDADAAGRLAAVSRSYEEELPRLDFARCPFTGWVQRHSFDPYGLDGLWWNYYAPARPPRERMPTCQAITGAVRIETPVESFPFLARPGPGAPFVIPHLLELPQVQAVLASLACGRHQAYCISYFTPDEAGGAEWPNDWGANERWDEGGASYGGWREAPDFEDEWDFHIAPWIERGKLAWIAPGDRNLALQRTVQGCPYLDLPGARCMQYVQDGRVWTAAEILAMNFERNEA
jgi:hypothetical protein